MSIRKPIIIEFTGPPNSGKTTILHSLTKELVSLGYTVELKKEDAEKVTSIVPKRTWDRNIWIAASQIETLIEAKYSTADIVLLDRGYYDAIFWAEFFAAQGKVSKEDSSVIIDFFNNLNSQSNIKPDLLYIIDVSVEESLKRRAMQSNEAVTCSTDDFLSLYKNELKHFCYKLRESNEVHYNVIDTTGCSKLEASVRVFSSLFQEIT